MSDLKPILSRIYAILPHLATAAQLAELRGDINWKLPRHIGDIDGKLARQSGDFSARLERLAGRIESLPTSWQMLTAIIAGQVTLAGLLCAAVFGAGRLSGHW